MRPIKLIVSAFGSYAEKAVIDFTNIPQGIFLIAGNTGSGKTTIFDAIMYALYGKTSGGLREEGMLRSQYASEKVKTFVEFTFEYHKEQYTVIRNPEHKIERRLKNGTIKYTKIPDKIELILPGGEVFLSGKKTECNKKIIDLIGLDCNQFSQTVMLAQGDFLKLLVSASEEKKKVFSKLFQTHIYANIEKELQNRKNDELSQMEQLAHIYQGEIERIQGKEQEECAEKWRELTAGRPLLHMDEMIQLLEKMQESQREAEKTRSLEIKRLSLELEKISSRIVKGEEAERIGRNLEAYKIQRGTLEQQGNQIEKKELELLEARNAQFLSDRAAILERAEKQAQDTIEHLEETKRERNKIKLEGAAFDLKRIEAKKAFEQIEEINAAKILKIETSMDSYRDFEDIEQQIKQLCQKKEEERKSFRGIGEIETRLQGQWDSNTEEMASLAEPISRETYLKLQYENNLTKKKEAECLTKEMERLASLKERQDTMKKHLFLVQQEYEHSEQEYERLQKEFLYGQAGILAEGLIKGQPCPVCGSTVHPLLAVKAKEVPTQQEIDLALEKREKLNQQRMNVSKEAGEFFEEYHESFNYVKNEAFRLFQIEYSSENQLKLLQAANQFVESLKKEKQQLEEIERKRKRYLELENNKAEVEKKLEQSQRQKRQIEITLSQLQNQIVFFREKQIQISAFLPYSSRLGAIHALNRYKKEVENAKNEFQNIERQYTKIMLTLSKLEGRIAEGEKAVQVAIEEQKESNTKFIDALKQMGFLTRKAYQNALREEAYQKQLQTEIQYYYQSYSSVSKHIEELEQRKERMEEIDIEEERQRKQNLEEHLEELRTERIILSNQVQNNHKITENIKKLQTDYQRHKKQLEIYHILYNTAGGRMEGNMKLDFETYIQRRYFTRVLHAANQRLLKMSFGQFILKMKDYKDAGQRSNKGLDLSVYSLVTNSVRDIKTLSGGEVFMAALAMALGLADVVQYMAGIIHLDMMFIDEGFGSLDEASRDQAVQILKELAEENRLVGIISHVPELKEQIDNCLLVRKTKKGSIIEWQNGEILKSII